MDKTSSEKREFVHYELTSDILCLGERLRAGTFRPCLDVFSYTTLVGAFKARFPQPYRPIHAVGHFRKYVPGANVHETFTFSPRDRAGGSSVIPLDVEIITNVAANIYVFHNDFTRTWPGVFTMHLGAMKSKGLGLCHLRRLGMVPCAPPAKGRLNVRLPESDIEYRRRAPAPSGATENGNPRAAPQPDSKPDSLRMVFGLQAVLAPVYGYLFVPEHGGTGYYTRALFEGSQIEADPILLEVTG